MSTESYANRVSQLSIQEELNSLAPTVDEQPVTDLSTGETVPKPEWVDKWANTVSPSSDLPAPEPEEPNGNTSAGFDPTNALTSLIVSRVEFEKFRAQVVMALKHQGIDVRKYFPE